MKWLILVLLAALPASSNYKLNNYGFGNGGGNSASANYKLNGITGQQSLSVTNSTNVQAKPGNNNAQQADVPPAPTLTNPDNYYDKLHLVIDPGPNATDAVFAIAISSDNFATTAFVKADHTVGSVLAFPADYQTYAAWGSGAGFNIIGLSPTTTYTVKVKAMHGQYTETGYGPTAAASTVAPQLSFDVQTDLQASPPLSVVLGDLLPGTVVTATNKIDVTLSTNADNGGDVYVGSANAGLKSQTTNTTIASATADLGSASTGYGAQGTNAAQSAGGPFAVQSPYNVTGNNVGGLTSALRQIFSTPAPITTGTGSVVLLAKAASTTPAANDYTDILTMVAAGSF